MTQQKNTDFSVLSRPSEHSNFRLTNGYYITGGNYD
jgi:hypothetical protein